MANDLNSGTSLSRRIPNGIGLSISPDSLIIWVTSGLDQTWKTLSSSSSVTSVRKASLRALAPVSYTHLTLPTMS